MEQATANDNALPWRLSGPDAEGSIWLEWEGEGPRERFNLGPCDQVEEALADWLAEQDFGERPPAPNAEKGAGTEAPAP
jgi:hypothetical protein